MSKRLLAHGAWRRLASRSWTVGIVMVLALVGTVCAQAPVRVDHIRLSSDDERTRLVFDLSGPVKHGLFTLTDPERVVVDLADARLDTSVRDLDFSHALVSRIRHGRHARKGLRVVLDLKQHATPKSFLLPPRGRYGNRLVIDLTAADTKGSAPVAEVRPATLPQRDVVIAIDAGHGGKDPGAIGHGGTFEKDIVLSVARRLERLVARAPGMRPVMTRDSDVFLKLRERIRRARKHKADLFISIHADASPNGHARGSSVYVLSRGGATSEAARWLAERENASDLIGGVSLSDKDDALARTLMDLSQTHTHRVSEDLAKDLMGSLARVGRLRARQVEKAGFVVLKSPDIPSVLVETAFISNPVEERRLRSTAHQQALARALLGGIKAYLGEHPPPGTRAARGRHIIRSGETLGGIADRYSVSVSELRSRNRLDGDGIHPGEVLIIPSKGS